MSDHYGIGNSLLGMFDVYRRMSRRSGRTTRMLEQVKEDCLIIVLTDQDRILLQRQMKALGKEATVVAVDVVGPHPGLLRGRQYSQVLLDHAWVEEYFRRDILVANSFLSALEQEITKKPPSNIDLRDERARFYDWKP